MEWFNEASQSTNPNPFIPYFIVINSFIILLLILPETPSLTELKSLLLEEVIVTSSNWCCTNKLIWFKSNAFLEGDNNCNIATAILCFNFDRCFEASKTDLVSRIWVLTSFWRCFLRSSKNEWNLHTHARTRLRLAKNYHFGRIFLPQSLTMSTCETQDPMP